LKKKVIGDCELYLGDCLEILPKLSGTDADMIFSDPPYGMRKKGIANDNLNYADLLEFNRKWILPSLDVLKTGGSWYCWGIEEPLMDIYGEILKPMIQNREITYRNFITWDKGSGQGQMAGSHRQYPRCNESCLFVTKGNRTVKKASKAKDFIEEYRDSKEIIIRELKKAGIGNKEYRQITGLKYKYGHLTTSSSWNMMPEKQYVQIRDYCKKNGVKAFEKPYSEIKNEYDKALLKWRRNRTYFDNTHENMNCVWHFSPVTNNSGEYCGHPAQKPTALCTRAVKTSCPQGGLVVDPFMGSGSAGVACLQLGRRYIGIEINEESFDIACKRIKEAYKQPMLETTTPYPPTPKGDI
jgi:DNA modification methylase